MGSECCSSWSLHAFYFLSKFYSIPLPDICAESAMRYTGFRSSGSNLIINGHFSEQRASQTGEFINNPPFLSIHGDGWFAVRLSMCWLVYYLSLFCANCEVKRVTCFLRAIHTPLLFNFHLVTNRSNVALRLWDSLLLGIGVKLMWVYNCSSVNKPPSGKYVLILL